MGSSFRFAAKDSGLFVVSRDKVTLLSSGKTVLVDQAKLVGDGRQLLAWSWYYIGDLQSSNDYVAKFGEAWASLGLGKTPSYRVVTVLPLQDSVVATQALLQNFLDVHGNALEIALQQAAALSQ